MEGRDTTDNDWQSRRWQGEGRVVRREEPARRPGGALPRPGPADGDLMHPDRGNHCAKCHTLDFLPTACDACALTFCADCASYDAHDCPARYTKNKTVPVCPLCQQAVPARQGEDPNAVMERHIASGCAKPQTAKVFTNRCNHPKCKKKELVQCICKGCGLNHCIKHRQPSDHNCSSLKQPKARPAGGGRRQAGGRGGASSAAAAAAERRAAAQGGRASQRAGRAASEPTPGTPAQRPTPAAQLARQPAQRPDLEPLIALGYSAEAAAAALEASGGDVQTAALMLLDNATAIAAGGPAGGGAQGCPSA